VFCGKHKLAEERREGERKERVGWRIISLTEKRRSLAHMRTKKQPLFEAADFGRWQICMREAGNEEEKEKKEE